MIKHFLIISFILIKSTYAESYVRAGGSLIWDSKNQNYTAFENVEFSNDKFIAHSDKMIAEYIEENNKEVFTKVELFDKVKIEFKDEIFLGDYAVYTRKDNIIKLVGNVTIQSPTRVLSGHELIADIDNNKRILNSANDESLVEALLDNNANN